MLSTVRANADKGPTRALNVREIPFLGVGLGYRAEFRQELLANRTQVDFLELMVEHFLDMPPEQMGDAPLLAEQFDIVVHGLDLSIGTVEPLRLDYLANMHELVVATGAHWASDHLSMTSVPGRAIGNLTPLPLNHEMADYLIQKCRQAARVLPVPFLLENISVLFRPAPDGMTEQAFITEVVQGADIFLLLDLTNILNNSINGRFDACDYLEGLPLDRVLQIHLAGGFALDDVLLDTHSGPVPPEAFELLRYAARRMPALRAVMIERDQNFPPFQTLLEELDATREVLCTAWAPHFASGLVAAPTWLVGRAGAG